MIKKFPLSLYASCVITILLISCSNTVQPVSSVLPTETQSPTAMTRATSSELPVAPSRTPDLTRPDTIRPAHAAEATPRSLLPTPTPISLGTPIPDSAEDEPLTENGPWLIYRAGVQSRNWFMINANGTGRESVELPEVLENSKLIPSHNSDYFAIYQYSDEADKVVMYIIHAPKMDIVETIDLVSYPGLIGSDAYHAAHTSTRHVFWYYEPLWSPDGRYLAFLGAIEGPSSDVYVYDTESDRVQRLTSGENHAANLVWSPDSLWIIHTEVDRFDRGCCEDATWAVSANGEVTIKLYKHACDHILAWIDPSTFIATDMRIEANREVRIIDLHQGHISLLFEGWFTNVAFDPIRVILVLDPRLEYPNTPDYPEGIYFLSADNPSLMMLETDYRGWLWRPRFQRIASEAVECDEGTIAALREDASYECIAKPPIDLIWSPNGQWGLPAAKHEVYDHNYNRIRTIMNSQAEEFLWGADSNSIFLIASGQLVYLKLPDGDLQMIDNRKPGEIAWVGVK